MSDNLVSKTSIAPLLSVRNGQKAIAFYKAAFDAAGATVVVPVSNEHGWHIGRVVDPFGHHWEISNPLEDQNS